jgi:hypothetical protein
MFQSVYIFLWYVILLPVAVALFAAGFWCIVLRNAPGAFELHRIEAIRGLRGRLLTWRANLITQTRLVIGFTLMIVGYHAGVWTDPLARIDFCVPVERWYILAAGLTLAAGGTLLAERMERREGPGKEHNRNSQEHNIS